MHVRGLLTMNRLIRPDLNPLCPDDEAGRRRWVLLVSPSAILPGDWPENAWGCMRLDGPVSYYL